MTTDKKARKEMPIDRGVLQYFPDAIAAVANVSFVGNQQHNPGQDMHWAREKSTDHSDCIARHLIEAGETDDDGLRHSAKLAWRSLAMLQLEIEKDRPKPYSIAEYINNADAAMYASSATAEKIVAEGLRHAAYSPHNYVAEVLATFLPYGDNHTFDVYPAVFVPETSNDNVGTDPQARALDAWMYANDYGDTNLRRKHDEMGLLFDHLDRLRCKTNVSHEIVGGTSINVGSRQYVYIAGPMRGYDAFNFPAFDAARDEFLQNGWNVISPADIDRAAGFSESVPDQPLDQKTFAYRDFYSLYLLAHLGNGAIAMLPGWEKSTGAVAEFFLARWLGLKILDATTGQPLGVSSFQRNYDLLTAMQTYLREQK